MPAAARRIYLVENKAAEEQHLVRAASQAQALGHVVRNDIDVRVATQDDLVALAGNGTKVEEAGA
jgi:hypothetical protein